MRTSAWQQTACILCSRNCGIEVQLAGGHLTHVRGDASHPISQGYLCQKAARLDYYQNHADRLTHPLRRRPDGSFERIPWSVAFRETAQALVRIRDTHGPHALAYYGGGGQGNHLGGIYGQGLRSALRTPYHYGPLAQEKTGDFWINGKLFGRQTCHVSEAVEDAEVVVLIGTNPWQAHGIRNARDTLRELGKDDSRKLIVVDPRRTESAQLADLHLPVRPGTDAFLMAACLAIVVREDWIDHAFHERHTTGFEAVRRNLMALDPKSLSARTGVAYQDIETMARWIGQAKTAAVRIDLGIQQSLHSTLNSYLEKLLFLVPGHFAKPGCNMLHSFFVPLMGHSADDGVRTRITGIREIGKLFPPNVLPAEIDNDRPDRLRGLVVDSANPVLSGADTQAYRAAFAKLEALVVIDVAFTETARMAHYVLPAASQLEKWETTFFTLEFPTQALQVREPLLPPLAEALPEPEIYKGLLVEMGELPAKGFIALRAAAWLHRRVPRLRLFPLALAAFFRLRPRFLQQAAFVLYDTLGRFLPKGAAAVAPLWAASHKYAQKYPSAVGRTGIPGHGAALGEALFDRILSSRSGVAVSTHTYEEGWELVRHPDGKVHLEVPEMLAELRALPVEPLHEDAQFPLVLIAGERRAYNANQIYRDPAWRKADGEGALHVHPEDARRLGLEKGTLAICESSRGAVQVRVTLSDMLQPGIVSLPHGFGMDYPDEQGVRKPNGPAINLLTDAAQRDPRTGTPYHKYVRVRVRPA